MVHLCPGISDDLDVLGQKLVSVLEQCELDSSQYLRIAILYSRDRKGPETNRIDQQSPLPKTKLNSLSFSLPDRRRRPRQRLLCYP